MPDRMSKDRLEDMPGRMPEDMSDRMPEDLPVTKRIDVMVGTTRSKVNHFSYEWDTRVAAPSIAHAIPTGTAALEEKNKEPSSIPGSRKPFRCRARRVGDDRVSKKKGKQTYPSGVNISHVLFTMGK